MSVIDPYILLGNCPCMRIKLNEIV